MRDLAEQVSFWFHEVRLTPTEIHRMLGCSRSTVYRILTEAGHTFSDGSKGGAQRRPFCARGHDMAVHGKELASGGR